MITHRGIWAIAHMLSRKHSCIPGAYPRKHLLIPCPTSLSHSPWPRRELVWSASDKRAPCERSEPNIQSNKSANRCKSVKIAKIVRTRNLHNFRTIDSVFFRHTFAIQVVNHWPAPIANSLRSGTRHAACSRARVPRNHHPNQEDPSSVHDTWAIIHMLSQQLAALKCFHCVTKVSYS